MPRQRSRTRQRVWRAQLALVAVGALLAAPPVSKAVASTLSLDVTPTVYSSQTAEIALTLSGSTDAQETLSAWYTLSSTACPAIAPTVSTASTPAYSPTSIGPGPFDTQGSFAPVPPQNYRVCAYLSFGDGSTDVQAEASTAYQSTSTGSAATVAIAAPSSIPYYHGVSFTVSGGASTSGGDVSVGLISPGTGCANSDLLQSQARLSVAGDPTVDAGVGVPVTGPKYAIHFTSEALQAGVYEICAQLSTPATQTGASQEIVASAIVKVANPVTPPGLVIRTCEALAPHRVANVRASRRVSCPTAEVVAKDYAVGLCGHGGGLLDQLGSTKPLQCDPIGYWRCTRSGLHRDAAQITCLSPGPGNVYLAGSVVTFHTGLR
jgi:hypothetical protein